MSQDAKKSLGAEPSLANEASKRKMTEAILSD